MNQPNASRGRIGLLAVLILALPGPIASADDAARVEGAAALLPTEPLGEYFLTADAARHALFEQQIFDAIEADGRLELVDRTELERVLAERKLELLDPQHGPTRPFIAADVFVLPYAVTRAAEPYLRIQAIHGPTASVLAELEVQITPGDPAGLDPPLGERVKGWWPSALDALHRVRTQPRWYLLDVYCDRLDEMPAAEAAFQALHEKLMHQEQIYLADGPVLTATQQELLMHIMGLSRDRAGGFAPTFDYLLDARLEPSGRLHLRVRDGRLETVAEREFDQQNPAERIEAAGRWLAGLTAAFPNKVVSDRGSEAAHRRWAHVQSRWEYNEAFELRLAYIDHREASEQYDPANPQSARSLPYGEAKSRLRRVGILYWRYFDAARKVDPQVDATPLDELPPVGRIYRGLPDLRFGPAIPKKRFLTRQRAAELSRRWIRRAADYRREYHAVEELVNQYKEEERPLGGAYTVRLLNAKELDIAASRYWRHVRRAAQLEPTFERAVLALGPPDAELIPRGPHQGTGAASFLARKDRLDAQHYFLRHFPASKRFEDVLFSYARESLSAATEAAEGRLPARLDRQRIARQLFRQGIDAYLDFNHRYVLTNEISVPYMAGEARFQHYGHLLFWIDRYFELAPPEPQERRQLVGEWSRRFDAEPKQAPHSDFVRLIVLSHQQDLSRFLELLRDVQGRWPDPQRLPWTTRPSYGGRHIVAADLVQSCLRRLCYNAGKEYDRDFRHWTDGQLPTDELPWMRAPAARQSETAGPPKT
jgi:hypothetical protein